VKALLSGAVKKPLMTKVSMTYLNKVTRERNQFSREAVEAWQDLVILKERMDTELAKVSKRNDFLVDELESWKDQFLKFQTFTKQLTKETQDLKVKIENYKNENKRLSLLINKQKDDALRLTTQLTGTEKQRDEALRALAVREQSIASLEREKQRNQEELNALQDNNLTLLRQRDEARRVVLHLHGLIEGQTRQMLDIVNSPPSPVVSDAGSSESEKLIKEVDEALRLHDNLAGIVPTLEVVAEEPNECSPSGIIIEMESTKKNDSLDFDGQVLSKFESRKKANRFSMPDAADKQLRFKTDAIADIIRNISEQCSAAAQGLQLAHTPEVEDMTDISSDRSSLLTDCPELVDSRSRTSLSTLGGLLTPNRHSLAMFNHELHDSPTKALDHDEEYFEQSNEEIQLGTATVFKLPTKVSRVSDATTIVSA
jgi:hypothetical protein